MAVRCPQEAMTALTWQELPISSKYDGMGGWYGIGMAFNREKSGATSIATGVGMYEREALGITYPFFVDDPVGCRYRGGYVALGISDGVLQGGCPYFTVHILFRSMLAMASRRRIEFYESHRRYVLWCTNITTSESALSMKLLLRGRRNSKDGIQVRI